MTTAAQESAAPIDASTVLGWLLDPPSVPDSAWYARVGKVLQKSLLKSPETIITLPSQHCPCECLLKILQSGTFRSQSTVLDAIDSAIEIQGRVCFEDSETGESGQVCLMMGPVLLQLSSEAGSHVLTAALQLCSEQQREAGDSAPPAAEKASEPFIQQVCCEDPYDCEEPAVREAALRLFARLCAAVAAALDAVTITAVADADDEELEGEAGDAEDAAAAAGLCAYRPILGEKISSNCANGPVNTAYTLRVLRRNG
jgi:hypothetical protein